MFEAKLNQAGILKHVLDAIRDLVTDVNFDCDEDGMKLQAMDNSHVALVALQLRAGGFGQYRCDRQMTLGINIPSFQKITKCAGNEDILTLRAYDDGDVLSIVSETLNTDRVAEYEMKMMDIDIEHLGIPTTSYDAEIALPSNEFNRIIRDLKEMGESIRIEATKEGVKFSATGDIGSGAVMLKHNADAKKAVAVDQEKEVMDVDSDEEENEDEEDEPKVRTEKKAKKEPDQNEEEPSQDPDNSQDVKPKSNGLKGKKKKGVIDDEDGDEDEQEQDEEEEEEEEEDEDEGPKSKKRKLSKKGSKATNGNSKAAKEKTKAAKEKKEKEEEDLSVSISLKQSVSLTFSIKYLSNFTKATPLAKRLTLHMSNEVPLLVAYEFDTGFVRYYLAPKIEDD